MTNHTKEQVLELGRQLHAEHFGFDADPNNAVFDGYVLAFAAAIEERNLARVAMLINGIDWAKRQFGSISFGDDVPIDNLLSAATVGYDNMAKLQAMYSTSTAEFLAERDARVLEEAADELGRIARNQSSPFLDMLRAMAAEKRKQAGQEGRGNGNG